MVIELNASFLCGFLFFLLTFQTIYVIILGYYVHKVYLKQLSAELSTHKLEYVPLDTPWTKSEAIPDKVDQDWGQNGEDAELDDADVDEFEANKRNLI